MDELDELRRWATIINKSNGYAGQFNYSNATDKQIVERCTVNEWASSMETEFDIKVEQIVANSDDPPDFFAQVGGKKSSVELVQMVERAHKQRAAKGESPYTGAFFRDAQWTKERLVSKLGNIISRKDTKYTSRGVKVDFLLVHTDETWLSYAQAAKFLSGVSFKLPQCISMVHLLFTYETGRNSDCWPLLILDCSE